MTETPIHTSGKRKTATARATLKEGDGNVTINGHTIEEFTSYTYQLKIKEPLLLAEDTAEDVNIKVNVEGGGVNGQASAVRLAIAKALAEYNEALKDVYEDYDRHLLVADVRRKETRKPNRQGKARSKRQKSYR
jgi:small subunit ribosomal protein S9